MKIKLNKMHIINLNTFSYRESILKGDTVLIKMSKNLHISFAAMTHLAKGLCLNALLKLKEENYLIYFVGTRIPTVTMME
jgi:hypothetical protein